jgi:CubicO group peptidase (beta-lactamase class C family)
LTAAPPGLDRLPATRDRLLQGIEDGLHIGVQLYVSLMGEVVCDAAAGEAREGVPMCPDTVLRWLSAGKPVAAAAMAQLVGRGLVSYDRPVAQYLPEFAQNGKETVTVRHVLTHTGGFRTGEPATMLPTWEDKVAGVCAARPEEGWVPGEKAGYHPNSGWVILGEIVRRVSGLPFDEYARKNIFEPLGMADSWAVTTHDLEARYGPRWGELHLTENGQRAVHSAFLTSSSLNVLRPGSTLRGPAHDLGRFYGALMDGATSPGGPLTLPPASVAEITQPQRVGMFDETFRHVMDWGLGVIIDSKKYGPGAPYGFGPHASPRTFGHGGSQSSLGFADPEHGLAVALIFNGLPGEARHDRRVKRVTAAIYEDLGLVTV